MTPPRPSRPRSPSLLRIGSVPRAGVLRALVRDRSVLVAVVAAVLVLLTGVLGGGLPGAQGAFIAAITNTSNTAATAEQFTATRGALPYKSAFSAGDLGWNEYGGTWTTANTPGGGVFSETQGGSGGNKATTGLTSWSDYTMQSDVRVDSGDEAGVIVRASHPTVGIDALQGYYAGIYTSNSTLKFGREDNGWTRLQMVPLPVAVTAGTWWHIVVQAVGCTFTVSAVPVGSTAAPTAFTVTDTGCTFTSGAIGVRDDNGTASWRNVTATAGGSTTTDVAPYLAPFAGIASSTTTPAGWTNYGGTWSADGTAETYADLTVGGNAGEKSVDGTRVFGDATLTADVRFDVDPQTVPNLGFLVRVTNPALGPDNLQGYYIGLSSTTLLVGREDPGWHVLGLQSLTQPLLQGQWWHVTIEMVGCSLTATAEIGTGGTQAVARVTDCTYASGNVGIRSLGAPSSFRQIAVTPR